MGTDMDPYCKQPTVVKDHRDGLKINEAIRGYCGEELKLWERWEEADGY